MVTKLYLKFLKRFQHHVPELAKFAVSSIRKQRKSGLLSRSPVGVRIWKEYSQTRIFSRSAKACSRGAERTRRNRYY